MVGAIAFATVPKLKHHILQKGLVYLKTDHLLSETSLAVPVRAGVLATCAVVVVVKDVRGRFLHALPDLAVGDTPLRDDDVVESSATVLAPVFFARFKWKSISHYAYEIIEFTVLAI